MTGGVSTGRVIGFRHRSGPVSSPDTSFVTVGFHLILIGNMRARDERFEGFRTGRNPVLWGVAVIRHRLTAR